VAALGVDGQVIMTTSKPRPAHSARKTCPSCGASFDCAACGCWFDEVSLTDSIRAALRATYTDYLCPACLRAVSKHSDRLMIQFLRWVAERPRTYADVMEAWRTSCPRQSAGKMRNSTDSSPPTPRV